MGPVRLADLKIDHYNTMASPRVEIWKSLGDTPISSRVFLAFSSQQRRRCPEDRRLPAAPQICHRCQSHSPTRCDHAAWWQSLEPAALSPCLPGNSPPSRLDPAAIDDGTAAH